MDDNKLLHVWAERVDNALNDYRLPTMNFENPEGVPHFMIAAGQVQWYQKWTGPHRWVTCESFEDRSEMVRAYFWTKGEWERRQEKVVNIEGDIGLFAREIWEFLKPLN